MTTGVWSTADYALIVSLCSAGLSLLSLGWNVWSKFIFPKPRLEVKTAFSYAVGTSGNWPPAITLTAINLGPLEITLKQVVGFIGPSFPFGTARRAILRAYKNWPYSSEETAFGETPSLPVRLAVGEQFSVHFPEGILADKRLLSLGFSDGFGREHFAGRSSRRNLKNSRRTKS